MAQVLISGLATGVPKGTDETPATDIADLSQAPSGTTKKYIRSDEFNYVLKALGFSTVPAVVAASTVALSAAYNNGASGVGATLTNTGAMANLVLDGVTLSLNDRVLIWNQAAPIQNGIYNLTTIGTSSINWVLTRSTDYDAPAEIIEGQVVLVNSGILYNGKAFQQTGASPFVIGTTPLTFALFSFAESSFIWSVITDSTVNMIGNHGYITNNAALVTLNLPLVSTVGQEVSIQGLGSGGWKIAQNAGQTINFGATSTTSGVAGYLASENRYDSLNLLCVIENTVWCLLGAAQGNINVI